MLRTQDCDDSNMNIYPQAEDMDGDLIDLIAMVRKKYSICFFRLYFLRTNCKVEHIYMMEEISMGWYSDLVSILQKAT